MDHLEGNVGANERCPGPGAITYFHLGCQRVVLTNRVDVLQRRYADPRVEQLYVVLFDEGEGSRASQHYGAFYHQFEFR